MARSTPPAGSGDDDVTRLLQRIEAGDEGAAARLYPLVYDHLHRLAQHAFGGRGAGHTLQPTVLVHDAYLKLIGHAGNLNDQAHFFVVAAKAMRQLLADHARAQRAEKRGGEWRRVTLQDVTPDSGSHELDLVALDEALTQLAALSERQARIAELRFLAGLEVDEVAQALGVSSRTVVADWRTARAFLRARLDESS